METAKNGLSLEELQKAFELLEILAAAGKGCSLTAVARTAGMSHYKATRLLSVLENEGVVECAVKTGRYDADRAKTLLRNLLECARDNRYVGGVVRSALVEQCDDLEVTLLKNARPILEDLGRLHNEAIFMAVRKGDEVFLLDMVDPHREGRKETFIGKCFPFFTNAAGKAMRAVDSWDLLEKIGKRWRSRGRGPDLAALKSELEQIREKGVAVDLSGMGDGIVTVAVAVKDYAGKVVGAVMLLGPSFRLMGERLEQEIIPSLRLGAELLSTRYGYARP